MQENRYDGSVILTDRATPEQILAALGDPRNKTVAALSDPARARRAGGRVTGSQNRMLARNLRAIAEALGPLWRRPRPLTGPATHDYTQRMIGHDYVIHSVKDGGQQLVVSGWGCGLVPGDFLILPNKGQTTRYQITADFDYYNDPKDMWHGVLEFSPRESSGGA